MSREDYIYYARLAEQGERYEDMIKYMKEVSKVSTLDNHWQWDINTIIIEWARTIKRRKKSVECGL